MQVAYVKALNGESHFTGRSAVKTWLFAIIRNTAIDHQRGHWLTKLVQANNGQFHGLAKNHGQEDSDAEEIRHALERLPRRQREVAHLVFYEGVTLREAAEVLQVSVGTARQHYNRAKTTLRNSLWHLMDRDELSTH